jgi:hypothetical protein
MQIGHAMIVKNKKGKKKKIEDKNKGVMRSPMILALLISYIQGLAARLL